MTVTKEMMNQTSNLLARVRNGNDWCVKAWQAVVDSKNDAELNSTWNLFGRGVDKLVNFAEQLESLDYRKCLYDVELCKKYPEKLTCHVCLKKPEVEKSVVDEVVIVDNFTKTFVIKENIENSIGNPPSRATSSTKSSVPSSAPSPSSTTDWENL